MTITICSSANFYRQAVDIQEQLTDKGMEVLVPDTAEKMKKSGDFDVSHVKTWYRNRDDYHIKTELMQGHFDKVAAADAILVLNYKKHGVENYIGGNVLMEMTLAFWLKKPIFIMNEIPEESSFIEEIIGLNPILLHGNLESLESKLKKLKLTA